MGVDGICDNCGTINPLQARFCYSCGGAIYLKSEQEQENDPCIGVVIGKRFRVLERVGEGGMGVVYRAEQLGMGRKVALKVLHADYAKDLRIMNRFRNEAALAAGFSHPNSVTVYDFGIHKEQMYLAMEFVDGNRLSDIQEDNQPLDWKRACRIVLQITSCLEEAHSFNIIHRDIKTDNIMLIERGEIKDIVKLLDFGIAKIVDNKFQQQGTSLTLAGEIFGTPSYISPEQILGNELDARTDLYSLGVVFYKLLTGRLPFEAEVPIALMAKHLQEKPPAFLEVCPKCEVPSQLEGLVMAALEKKPENRPSCMRDFGAEIASVYGIPSKNPEYITAPFQDAENLVRIKESLCPDIYVVEEEPLLEYKPEQVLTGEYTDNDQEQKSDEQNLDNNSNSQTGNQNEVSQDIIVLEKLADRIAKSYNFPGVASHISEINTKTGRDNTSANQLANVILKDFALTTKLLNLINSAFYGQVRGKVKTISRAVVLMGFEQVRQITIGMLMFDQFASKDINTARELREEVIQSVMSGMIAKKAASRIDGLNPEEALICGMFHHLGKNLVVLCLPDKWKQIQEIVKNGNADVRMAAKVVLGVSFEDLGSAVATRWDFPSGIVKTMRPLPGGVLNPAKNKDERLGQIVGFAHEFTDSITANSANESATIINDLFSRFNKTIPFKIGEMDSLVIELQSELQNYTKLFSIDTKGAKILDKLSKWTGIPVSEVSEHSASSDDSKKKDPSAISTAKAAQIAAKKEHIERERILINGIEDVARSVIRREDINGVLVQLLETMYRGLGLAHVLFCLTEEDENRMCAKTGFGDNIDDYVRQFRFSIAKNKGNKDLFSTALNLNKDYIINCEKDRIHSAMLPEWFRKIASPSSILVLPLVIDGNPVGLFYGDLTKHNATIDRSLVKHVFQLRNQVVAAIKKTFIHGGKRIAMR